MAGWIVAGVLYVMGVVYVMLTDMDAGERWYSALGIGVVWPLALPLGCLFWVLDWLNDKLLRRI